MCYRPVHIFNNTNSLRAIDSTSILAPCGDCEECRTIRACEYTFRIYNEMEYRSNQGYNLFFVTLTYNDYCLPHATVTNSYNKGVTIECFRRSDVIGFFKKIRKYLLKKYGVVSISYVCASEYGSHTQRPHYHCMLGLPSTAVIKQVNKEELSRGIKEGDVVELTSELVHGLVQKYWTYGFIFPRYYYGGVDGNGYCHKPFQVKPTDIKPAAFYIAKYCCKDLVFYGLPSVQLYKKLVQAKIKAKDATEKSKLEAKRLLSEHMTFVITSRHFGEHINDLVNCAEDLINGVSTTMNSDKLVPVPMYNKRKLIYSVRTVKDDPNIKVLDKVYEDFDEVRYLDLLWMSRRIYKVKPNDSYLRSLCTSVITKYKYKVRYDITPLGKDYFTQFLKYRISTTEESIKDFLDNVVKTKEFKDFYEDKYSKYDYNYDGTKVLLEKSSSDDWVRSIKYALYDKIHDLAVYSVVYRNRVSPLHLQFYLNNNDIFYERKEEVVKTKVFHPIYNSQLIVRKEVRLNCREVFKCLNSISKKKKISWTSVNNELFLGSESLSEMSTRAESFYVKNLDGDRYVDENKVDVMKVYSQRLVHFNSFPCFQGFDELIEVMSVYCRLQNRDIYETRATRQREMDKYKQVLTEVNY